MGEKLGGEGPGGGRYSHGQYGGAASEFYELIIPSVLAMGSQKQLINQVFSEWGKSWEGKARVEIT